MGVSDRKVLQRISRHNFSGSRTVVWPSGRWTFNSILYLLVAMNEFEYLQLLPMYANAKVLPDKRYDCSFDNLIIIVVGIGEMTHLAMSDVQSNFV